MLNFSILPNALFFSAIHMDRLGRIDGPPILGSSNPGLVEEIAGGASLNSASVASLLGLDCTVLGLVGDDQHGLYLRDILRSRGIGDALKVQENSVTGSYTAILAPDGDLVIALADLGLNERLTVDFLREHYHHQMATADIWFLNANLTSETLSTLCHRDYDLRPALVSAASVSPAKAQHLVASLACLDLLFTNLREANALIFARADIEECDMLDAAQCVDKLREIGIAMGTLSQGAGVLWAWDEHGIYRFKPDIMDRVIDVTGAGDALAAVILAGLAKGEPIDRCAPLAIAAAQMTIRVKGPYNDKISNEELKLQAERVTQIC